MPKPLMTLNSIVLLLTPSAAHAHTGAPIEPHDLWRAWSFEPFIIALLAFGALTYSRGVITLRRRAGGSRGLASWRVHCFAAAIATLAMALLSPVDAAGEALFSAHMVQHLLLTMIAAPLLVLAEPMATMLRGMPLPVRRGIAIAWRAAAAARATWHALTRPAIAWALHVGALVAWHLPACYEAAIRNDAVHALEHASFLTTAVLFWWPVLTPRARRRLNAGSVLLYLFAAALASTIIGALITLSRRPWYGIHARTAIPWGLNALEDQQLAGLLMWVPPGLVYIGVMMAAMLPLLRDRRVATPS